MDDEPCARGSIEVQTDKNRHRVQKLNLRNCWVVTELKAAAELARCQIQQFIQKLGFRKIYACWVPKMLTEGKEGPPYFNSSYFITTVHRLFSKS